MYTRTPEGCTPVTKLGPMHISHYGIRHAFRNEYYVYALAETRADCKRLAYALGLEKSSEQRVGTVHHTTYFGHGQAKLQRAYGAYMLQISTQTWDKENA